MKPTLIRHCLVLAVHALLLQSIPALADQLPPHPVGAPGDIANFDWVKHTQRTIAELKGKLNLTPDQTAAWDNWSAGVMNDARQQIERNRLWQEQMGKVPAPASDATPERMARGIERLRAEAAEMQRHLARLEAAQVRTKAFYDKLDANQKTIFDLYWQGVHHRDVGRGHGHGMHEGGPGPLRGERGGPGKG